MLPAALIPLAAAGIGAAASIGSALLAPKPKAPPVPTTPPTPAPQQQPVGSQTAAVPQQTPSFLAAAAAPTMGQQGQKSLLGQ